MQQVFQYRNLPRGRLGIYSARGAIDSVMLMDELRRKTGGNVCGRDTNSVFNSLDREKMYEILKEHKEIQ